MGAGGIALMVKLVDSDIKTREVLDWQGVHLLHFSSSACSQKTRIFLNLKGIDWVSHPINLARQENYQPWFLGINPRGLVPVLVHNGEVHIESNDILYYLDDYFPGSKLIPTQQRDDVMDALKIEDDLHMDLRTLTMRYLIPRKLAKKSTQSMTTYDADEGTVEGETDPHKAVELAFWQQYNQHGISNEQAHRSLHKFKAIYGQLDETLATTPYLAGANLSLMDIAWFIYTQRLTDTGYPFARLHLHVYRWYKKLAAREEFSKEVKSPMALKVMASILQFSQKISGNGLEKVAGF
jgi:glutathione S-transferase